MKELYEKPELVLINFNLLDIITAGSVEQPGGSGNVGDGNDDDFEW